MRSRLLAAGLFCVASCSPSAPETEAAGGARAQQQIVDSAAPAKPLEAPSYSLRFLEQAAAEPVRWEARLVERDSTGHLDIWPWRILVKGTPDPRLIYEGRGRDLPAGSQAFVEVHLRDGDWLGRAPVPALSGDQSVPLELDLVQLAIFGGRLLDVSDRAIRGAELRLYQERGSELDLFHLGPHVVASDEHGDFLFGAVEPGGYHLLVRSEGRPDTVLDVELDSGVAEGPTLRLVDVPRVGELPIAVVGASEDELPAVLLTLRSLDGQHVRRFVHTRTLGDDLAQISELGVGYAVLFPLLPEGRYELSVLGMDSRRYEPETIELDFDELGEGVLIQAVPAGDARELRFLVRDHESKRPLAESFMRFTSDDWWPSLGVYADGDQPVAGLASNTPTPDWMVVVVGYQPAYGTYAPAPDAVESVLETVDLKPGWGAELFFRDGRSHLPGRDVDSWGRTAEVRMADPVPGVVVIADGRVLGRSDEHGRIRLKLDRPPRRLQFRLAGWSELPAHLTGFNDAHRIGLLGASGSAVVWMDAAH